VGYPFDIAPAVVSLARAAGMKVGGYFIVGLPGKSVSETLQSVCYALRLDLAMANFTPFWFAPGSP
jgi:radical SAM superfamily enzyme YgiQ (UPF0313 family)